MDDKSFSVMAYQTARRCVEEIARLRLLVQNALQHIDSDDISELIEAHHSLEIMSTAVSKLRKLKNPEINGQEFSDVDVLDYEYSTAIAVSVVVGFPEEKIEFARQSYYQLLSFVMGFLEAFSEMYMYLRHMPRNLEDLGGYNWISLQMRARVAWVEKQLLGWGAVAAAIEDCREYHSFTPFLKTQAVSALSQWSASEQILSGCVGGEMNLCVISGQGLPRGRSFMVKVVSSP